MPFVRSKEVEQRTDTYDNMNNSNNNHQYQNNNRMTAEDPFTDSLRLIGDMSVKDSAMQKGNILKRPESNWGGYSLMGSFRAGAATKRNSKSTRTH